jgi:hypothetical protein
MNLTIACKVALISLALFVAQTAAQSPRKTLANLSWLAGCWESRDEGKNLFISEQWMKPAGGMMLGIGRTVKSGKAVDYEFMRIEQRGADMFYVARPKENKEDTSFMLVKWGLNAATFENPAHDFPQRIIYSLRKSGLFARIEGKNNGKPMGIDFPMKKVQCE